MQIKSTVRYHLISVRMAVVKKMAKMLVRMWRKGNPHNVGGNVNCYHYYGK